MGARQLLWWRAAGGALLTSTAVSGESAAEAGADEPRLLFFNHGYDFPITFDREFDFDQLPFDGEYHDVTLDGIRVQAPGRFWQHIDGSPLGGRAARQRDAEERWIIDLPADSYAFEFKLWESSLPGVGPDRCFNFDFCTDTLYRISVYGGDGLIEAFDFSHYNDVLNTMALWSSAPITRIEMTAIVNNVDDEFFGDMRTGSTPLPAGLDIAASQQNSNFGADAALRDGRAVVSDSAGFEFWRRVDPEIWAYSGRLDFGGSIVRTAMSADHAVFAMSTGKLRIHEIQDDDPTLWPLTEIPYSGAAQDLEIENDLIALGIDGQVLLHRQVPVDGWILETSLLPDPPIPDSTEFGRDIAMDGDLLVVSAGNGRFHIYQRGLGAQFDEIFRQEQLLTSRSKLDVSGSTVAVQTFEGGLRLFDPDGSGAWASSEFPTVGLPPEIGLALGEGIRIDGDTFIALQGYQNSPSPAFRRIVSVFRRGGATGKFVRTALFVEPHQHPTLETNLGSGGSAFALDGDDILLGYPATSWCDQEFGTRSFFGDSGSQNYAAVCAGRSGAAYFARASLLERIIFESSFEP